uniref:Uncharacterized protein n=1 Tax=Molossus molossus TaxID=27622 RepID=A0A7J8BJR5_MOLMO|nr:hypothetical protein HJG59_010208 [Molossus molossus]
MNRILFLVCVCGGGSRTLGLEVLQILPHIFLSKLSPFSFHRAFTRRRGFVCAVWGSCRVHASRAERTARLGPLAASLSCGAQPGGVRMLENTAQERILDSAPRLLKGDLFNPIKHLCCSFNVT